MADRQVTFNVRVKVDGADKVAAVSVSTRDLGKAFATAQGEIGKANAVLINFNQRIEGIRNMVGAVQDLAGKLSGLTADARGFEDAMRRTNTLAGKDESGFSQLREQVDELSRRIPIARDALAEGLYTVISSDLPEDNWMSMLEQSTKAAIGGQADLERVVSVTATVIKNYGMAWEDAGAIQDKIQNTAKVGETTFEEMAASLPRVAASAATLGVELDELMGAYATLTGVSGDTSEVTTQLLSALNGLIKPSSEATNLAEQMGIAFDAAAVKAAGGFASFLEQLDRDISSFSASTGMLREEVYGRLFGNAEALKALLPLTGELRDKFVENVGEMSDTAGTLDRAVEQMSQTSEARTQLMKNQWSSLGDMVQSALGGVLPVAETALEGITTLSTTLIAASYAWNTLRGSVLATTLATRASSVASTVWNAVARLVTGSNTALGVSSSAASAGLTAMQMSLRGLLIASGVGVVVVALTTGLQALVDVLSSASSRQREAEERARRLREELDGLTTSEERHRSALEQSTSSLRQELSTLEQDIARLKDWQGTKEAEVRLVGELNSRYGETMGYFESVSAWYVALTRNSRAYCDQLVNEARLRALANETAELQEDVRKIRYNEDGSLRRYSTRKVGGELKYDPFTETSTMVGGKSDLDVANAALRKNYAQIRANRKEMASLAKESVSMVVTGSKVAPRASGTSGGSGGGGKSGGGRKSAGGGNSGGDVAGGDVAEAAAGSYAALSAEVRRLEEELERLSPTETDQVGLLMEKKQALEGEMEAIRALWASYEVEPEAAKVETDARKLSTTREIDAAIAALGERQATESGSALMATEKEIAALERKREALEALKDAARWEADLEGLGDAGTTAAEGATGGETTIAARLELLGVDEIEERIATLRKLLRSDDLDVGDKAGISEQIGEWERYEKTLKKSDAGFKEVYASVKGVGGGVEQMIDSVKGSGSAWDKLTGVLDGAMQTYESLQAFMEMMNTLLDLNTAKEGVNATAKSTSAAVDSATTGTQVANSEQKAAAAGQEATMELTSAGAKVMSAHASIPFVGVAIGAGLLATMLALMLALPKFAEGGLAYGPTLGLFGEYAGAASNPEVVAPLSRLRSLLGMGDGGGVGEVRFRIRGADLEGVLKRREDLLRRG